jgi:hypothetical protein
LSSDFAGTLEDRTDLQYQSSKLRNDRFEIVGNRPDRIIKANRTLHLPERRGARRFSVDWKATVKGTDSEGIEFDESGELRNLSSSGAYLYLGKQLNVGSRIDVWIKLPLQKENWMRYRAEVVRVEGDRQMAGIGMQFCEVWPRFQSR